MHTHSSDTDPITPLSEPERTLNRRRRRNKNVSIERKDKRQENPKEIFLPILDITHFQFFIKLIKLHDPMENADDEPMWATDRVVAPTHGLTITIPETANEFAIKGNHLTLVKGNQFDGCNKTDPHKHIHEFLGVCDMFIYGATKTEEVRLMMFPLSLTGEAKTWIDELDEGTIETWDERQTTFISKFSPQLYSIDFSKKSEDFPKINVKLSLKHGIV
ncbi:reverse transcriptase domain-containing protein [Tanacetum coccineum]|uniref:Reverse transcriptase domain-containing protein n=1 Tax=Tanacetum coccineum TaxID=301880 RepID=A0ABQ4WSL2_9ASTR